MSTRQGELRAGGDRFAAAMEHLQSQVREGPARVVLETGAPVSVPDLGLISDWPIFSVAASAFRTEDEVREQATAMLVARAVDLLMARTLCGPDEAFALLHQLCHDNGTIPHAQAAVIIDRATRGVATLNMR